MMTKLRAFLMAADVPSPRFGGKTAVHCQNPISRNCCWACCACRMSRTVFLSAQPCFQGLHRPHADALRALTRRFVRFVFMEIYAIASCIAASGSTSRSMTRAFSCRASRKS
jgi:hypothetical protein